MRKIDNEESLFLGEIFESTMNNLIKNGTLSPYKEWPELSFPLSKFMGIDVLESSVRAPFTDRPILQQHFELAFTEDSHLRPLESQYLSKINSVFGEPKSVAKYATKEANSIRYAAQWIKDDFSVSLSIYGSGREQREGTSTAGLFFDLVDDIAIGAPFLEQRRHLEKSLWPRVDGLEIVYSTQTVQTNSPYFRPDYERGLISIEQVSDHLRQSQKALFKRYLLETPSMILIESQKGGLIIWRTLGNYFLSLNQDTVQLKPHDTKFEFYTIKPARGPGGTRLTVGELDICDVPNSQALQKLKVIIEEIVDQKAKLKEYYDD